MFSKAKQIESLSCYVLVFKGRVVVHDREWVGLVVVPLDKPACSAKQVAPSLQHHPPPERHARGQSSPPVSIVGAAIDDSGESGLCHLTPKLKTYVAAHRTTCHANTTAFAAQTPR